MYTIDQFLFSPGQHVLTVVYNVTSGRVGEYRQNFTGEIRPCMFKFLDPILSVHDVRLRILFT